MNDVKKMSDFMQQSRSREADTSSAVPNKFPEFCATRNIITMLTTSRHLFLS